jgi:hypothetical protein
VYRPTWDWCKACNGVHDPVETGEKGERTGVVRTGFSGGADSLDDLRDTSA